MPFVFMGVLCVSVSIYMAAMYLWRICAFVYVCLLGIICSACYWLHLGARSCSNFTSLGLQNSALPQNLLQCVHYKVHLKIQAQAVVSVHSLMRENISVERMLKA